MKHACEHCQQRYDIPDEKVLGKILKVRCKTCGGYERNGHRRIILMKSVLQP